MVEPNLQILRLEKDFNKLGTELKFVRRENSNLRNELDDVKSSLGLNKQALLILSKGTELEKAVQLISDENKDLATKLEKAHKERDEALGQILVYKQIADENSIKYNDYTYELETRSSTLKKILDKREAMLKSLQIIIGNNVTNFPIGLLSKKKINIDPENAVNTFFAEADQMKRELEYQYEMNEKLRVMMKQDERHFTNISILIDRILDECDLPEDLCGDFDKIRTHVLIRMQAAHENTPDKRSNKRKADSGSKMVEDICESPENRNKTPDMNASFTMGENMFKKLSSVPKLDFSKLSRIATAQQKKQQAAPKVPSIKIPAPKNESSSEEQENQLDKSFIAGESLPKKSNNLLSQSFDVKMNSKKMSSFFAVQDKNNKQIKKSHIINHQNKLPKISEIQQEI